MTRIPKNRLSTHPGEMLREEFLIPLGISQKALADAIRVPFQRVNEIVTGKRGLTPGTALRQILRHVRRIPAKPPNQNAFD